MCGLNPPLYALLIWRKKLLQFQRYRIFPRGLLFYGAPCISANYMFCELRVFRLIVCQAKTSYVNGAATTITSFLPDARMRSIVRVCQTLLACLLFFVVLSTCAGLSISSMVVSHTHTTDPDGAHLRLFRSPNLKNFDKN